MNNVTSTPELPKPVLNERTRLLLEGKIVPTLLKLSLPNTLYFVATLGLIMFDGLITSQLGLDALAGVVLVFPFVMALMHVSGSGVGGAVSAAVARALGSGARERAAALASHAILLAVGLTGIVMAVMLPFGEAIYAWMGARGPMLEAALAYSNVVFGGAIAVCLFNILTSIARGTGNMALPALVQVCVVAAHFVVSPLLVFGAGPLPGLGVVGAAAGFVVCYAAGCVWLLAYLCQSAAPVPLRISGAEFRTEHFSEILRVGVPGMLNVAANNLSVVLMTSIAGRLGRDVQIGYALAARLEHVIIPLAFVFGMSLVAMVGTNWGGRQYARARRIAWTGGTMAGICCGLVGMGYAIRPDLWMDMFTDQPDLIKIGSLYLLVVGPTLALFGFGQALYFSRQGLGTPLPAVVANLVRFGVTVGGSLIAIQWFDGEALSLFIAIAAGFVVYAILNAWILWRTGDPPAL